MNYKLIGPPLKIDTPTIRKHIGKKVEYILTKSPFIKCTGTIIDIIRKQIDFGNSDYIPFDKIKQITLIEKIDE